MYHQFSGGKLTSGSKRRFLLIRLRCLFSMCVLKEQKHQQWKWLLTTILLFIAISSEYHNICNLLVLHFKTSTMCLQQYGMNKPFVTDQAFTYFLTTPTNLERPMKGLYVNLAMVVHLYHQGALNPRHQFFIHV